MSSTATPCAAASSTKESLPQFEMIMEICAPSLMDAPVNAPELPVDFWETAWLDLDEMHKKTEADLPPNHPYLGRRYLIHTNTVADVTVDYILERTDRLSTRWNPVMVLYRADKEESPYESTEEWYPPQSINEIDLDAVIAMPGQCYNCSVPSVRVCYDCGVGICDRCAPKSEICPICVMENQEYE